MNFRGKKILVMGLGLFGGGVGITRFLARQGARVTVTDLKPAKDLKQSLNALSDLPGINYRLGEHRESDIKESDLLVVNPSVPSDSPYLALARKHRIPLETEMNLFFKLCSAWIIGITGSNGKTTTTALIGEILKAHFPRVWIGGNIGRGSLLDKVEKIGADDLVVLELSSFQLEDLGKIKKSPFMAVILNIKPNHLDRHKAMANYIKAKKNIIRYQPEDSYAILNRDDPEISSWSNDCRGKVIFFSQRRKLAAGAFIKDKYFAFTPGRRMAELICRISDTHLLGDFNQENILAAISVTRTMGVPSAAIRQVIKRFPGVEHRLEFVRETKGIKYYNDSIATNPESTIGALHALGKTRGTSNVILIAGGYDKQLPFDNLAREIVKWVRIAVLLGATAPKLKALLLAKGMDEKNILPVSSLPEAVAVSTHRSRKGDIVLLSPACASYDMFNNFVERGNLFKRLVGRLP